MNILISPQAFKGSISAIEVANNIEKGIIKANPNHNIIKLPVADGGDNTLDTLVGVTKGKIYETTATGPDGKKIKTKWGALGDNKTAVIEMAKISGLTLMDRNNLKPYTYTTYGMGEVIKECLNYGFNNFIIGIGGSATNDGGLGMAEALGAILKDKNNKPIKRGIKGLGSLNTIDLKNIDKRIRNSSFQIACDVNNPLYGPNGATYIFGPQKGFNSKEIELIDSYMKNYGNLIDSISKKEISKHPGSGAAGGIGAAAMYFLNAKLKSGSGIVLDYLEFTKHCQNIDIVITGEGQIDFQTINNKAPIAVARIAKKHQIPVFAICGILGKDYQKVYKEGIKKIYPLCNNEKDIEYSINNANKLIQDKAYSIIKDNFI
ncbi:MAG TPA: glycerate kinase [Dehalococcoidia bacterium]|nr:glycerate kinase [Dehalococcoidia bacterium]